MLDAAMLDKRLGETVIKEGGALSGLAVALLDGGKVVHEACFGRRYIDPSDGAQDLPVQADTLFRVASISKTVTALGAMLLVERGLLDLDGDLSGYLGFDFRNPSFPRDKITAAMLLSHTSSVRDDGGYVLPLPYRMEDFVLGRGEAAKGYGSLHWATPIDGRDPSPGGYFCYSNLNYGILATVMEKLSGERFDTYMRDRVLRPLGIGGGYNAADFSDEELSRLAVLYRKAGADDAWHTDGPWVPQVDDLRGKRPALACRIAAGLGPQLLEDYEIGTNGAIFSPQGGLRICLRDLEKVAGLYMGGGEVGGKRLISPASVQRMMTERWSYDAGRRNGELYNGLTRATGLGLARTTAARDEQGGDRLLEWGGPRMWGHHGDAYGLLGGMLFDPKEGFGFIYLIGGSASPPEKSRGKYSSWFIWEEEIQEAILEEAGRGAPHSGRAALAGTTSAAAPVEGDAYRTGLLGWRGALGELGCFSLEGIIADSRGLVFDPANALRQGEFLVGEATSPILLTDFPVSEAIPSWNAQTPEGSRLDVLVRARRGGAWSGWYVLGQWCATTTAFARSSREGQEDSFGTVKTDTLVLASPADALQARIRFLVSVDKAPAGTDGKASEGLPFLRNFYLASSSSKAKAPSGAAATGGGPGARQGATALRGRVLEAVPTFSQMVYPDGGSTWCSPTSVSMVLSYWEGGDEAAQACVRRAVAGVYDKAYDGYGNWSFNTAYAGTRGYDACVARFASLAELEPFIAAGIPVVMSVSWNEEGGRPLPGAPVKRSAGHLTLLVGFDAAGDPVMNEPAAADPAGVRRGYPRASLEVRWLEASGGTVYLIVPSGKSLPGRG